MGNISSPRKMEEIADPKKIKNFRKNLVPHGSFQSKHEG